MKTAAADEAVEFLTLGSVARLLGVSSMWACELIRRGRLEPSAHTDRGIRLFSRSDVEALQREREARRAS